MKQKQKHGNIYAYQYTIDRARVYIRQKMQFECQNRIVRGETVLPYYEKNQIESINERLGQVVSIISKMWYTMLVVLLFSGVMLCVSVHLHEETKRDRDRD